VLAASQTVVSLQSIVARDVDPITPAVVSIGSIHAGHAPNVLPAEAVLSGTLRAADRAARERLRERVAAIARATAAAHGIEVELSFTGGYPPTVNDPAAARIVREAAAQVLGAGAVLEGPPTMAAEDFSFFLEERPGAFVLLGMRDEASGAVQPHHSPGFRIAPAALPLGLEILLRGAVALMARGVKRGG
jgi:amidohydrolase